MIALDDDRAYVGTLQGTPTAAVEERGQRYPLPRVSGPQGDQASTAHLAERILLEHTWGDRRRAKALAPAFAADVIDGLPADGFRLRCDYVAWWMRQQGGGGTQ